MAQITVMFFGQLAEITGSNQVVVDDVVDTDTLQTLLHKKHPALKTAKYVVAVNKRLTSQNTGLQTANTVALLPPFSGG